MESRPTTPSPGPEPLPAPQVAYIIKPRPKWQALRTIATVLKFCAWVLGGLGVIAALVTLTGGNQLGACGTTAGLMVGVWELLGAGVGFLGLYGSAEVILLLIAIEGNTHKL